MPDPADAALPSGACRNCRTPLLGPHCHHCGQTARDPLKHLRDALADAFETVFDIDGRILRTLRDLLVPGRVAINYLAGRRARYIAPLRLFLVLTVLTFFVAHFAVDSAGVDVDLTDMDHSAIAAATTEAEVEAARAAQFAILTRKRAELSPGPGREGRQAALDARAEAVKRIAETRIAALRQARAAGQPPPAPMRDFEDFKVGGKRWDARTNPVKLEGLPAFANAWINTAIGRGMANAKRYLRDQGALKDAWLTTIPTVLFFLVPVFAVLLRIAYAFSPWRWLEHLVVALYSHAILLLMALLAMLVLLLTRSTVLAGIGEASTGWIMLAAMVYLLWMQKRVYRQGWPMTLLKFCVLGMVYSVLLGLGSLVALGSVFLQ